MPLPLFIAGAAGLLALLEGCDKSNGRAKNEQKSNREDPDTNARSLPNYAKVTDIYWSTIGPDGKYKKIEHGGSHDFFYVELNLHVITVDEDELENITISKEGSGYLYGDQKVFSPKTMCQPMAKGYHWIGSRKEFVFENVLAGLKININEDNLELKIVAEHEISGNVAEVKIVRPRPWWKDVFDGYPKAKLASTNCCGSQNAEDVFESVFGPKYDKTVFANACATRVSIALLKAGITIPKKPYKYEEGSKGEILGVHEVISTELKLPEHCYVLTGARYMGQWLEYIWGSADVLINTNDLYKSFGGIKTTMKEAGKIKIGNRNGVYIIVLPPEQGSVTGHATLWDGDCGDAFDTQNLLDRNNGKAYFWELR